ncbi:MAG TPA: hypothetical protein VKB50_07770 [Vicinamibacterales bacterium]|nr:hypothetical protein [Vicinamibacterales bacterium]
MRLGLIRLSLATTMMGVLGSMALSAQGAAQQPPAGTNNGVQVAVPQGGAADQAQDAARQNRQQAARNRLANQPAPRDASGHIVLGNTATLKGVWVGGNLGFCNGNAAAAPPSLNPGAGPQGGRAAGTGAAPGRGGGFGRGAAGPCTAIPYMEWTRAVSDDRRRMQLEPHTRCKPSGGPRQWLTPYGAEFLELPDAKVAYIFDIGGPHTYRTIYMDRRKHPETVTPSFYGDSIGWWEGDTLVVDTVGFNEGFWIDRGQLPHTSQLHLIEKYTRTALDSMKYELTIDDPGAYTSTFTGVSNLRWENGTELFEYVCQQQNYAPTLMVGEGTKVDRSSPIVP